jgi:hypothetical protein
MKRRLLVVAVIALAGAGRAAELVKPGYWEATDKILSPVESTKVERRCITPADVSKFMMGPSNHIYACTYPEQSAANGVIDFKGRCVDKKGHVVQIGGHGTYTATTLNLTADVAFTLFGLPIAARASTTAHRIGDVCPPPDK